MWTSNRNLLKTTVLSVLMFLSCFNVRAEPIEKTPHLIKHNAVLSEAGTDLFATVQEVIKKLSADPKTDWSKVDLEALRQHLRDMFEFSYNVDVLSQQAIEHGVKIRAKPLTDRAGKALDKVLNAHPMMLKMETGWTMQSSKIDDEYQIIVTSTRPSEVNKIRALGYIGLLAIGNHHQPHHWAMATGRNPHHEMHH